MYLIRKQFKFEMAHQLFTSYSDACHENLHGHSYILELFLSPKSSNMLDDTGMVVDFGEVKDLINDYVNSWDHSLTMPDMFDDQYLKMLSRYTKKFRAVSYNPTAENMAKDMFDTISKKLENKKTFKVVKVRLHETTTGWAEYSKEND